MSSILIVMILNLNCLLTEDHEMILQNYVNTVFYSVNIRLLHSKTQLGLIRARLAGALLAKGEVIVSMDSHMEVQERWYGWLNWTLFRLRWVIKLCCSYGRLEPLLEEIRKNPRTMATSYLDWMEREIGSGQFFVLSVVCADHCIQCSTCLFVSPFANELQTIGCTSMVPAHGRLTLIGALSSASKTLPSHS